MERPWHTVSTDSPRSTLGHRWASVALVYAGFLLVFYGPCLLFFRPLSIFNQGRRRSTREQFWFAVQLERTCALKLKRNWAKQTHDFAMLFSEQGTHKNIVSFSTSSTLIIHHVHIYFKVLNYETFWVIVVWNGRQTLSCFTSVYIHSPRCSGVPVLHDKHRLPAPSERRCRSDPSHVGSERMY